MISLKNYFVNTSKEVDVIAITGDVRLTMRDVGLNDGLVTVAVPLSGAALLIAEPLADIVAGLKDAFNIFPGEGKAALTRRKESVPIGPLIKAALIGRNLTVPFAAGNLLIGPRDEILLVDFESFGRRREYAVQVVGEGDDAQGRGVALGAFGAEAM